MAIEKIQHAIYNLLEKEPFYAHFILNSKVAYDQYGVPTAAAAVVSGTPLLVFNTAFLNSLSQPEVTAILKHEVLHLVLMHTETMQSEKKDRYLANLAYDCAINQYIDNLPKSGITLDVASKAVGKRLEAFQTSDYYYEMFEQKAKELAKSGAKTTDEHNAEIPGQDKPEMAKAAVENATKKAADQSAGNVPECVVKVLDSFGQGKLPWQQLLRNAIMTQVERRTLATHKKINRRFKLPVPGKKQKRTMTLGVCADSSGSVSDQAFALFMDEIQSIAKLITKTYFIDADCVVQNVQDLSKKKLNRQRTGSGGTAYQPAIDKCLELKCNMIIYFGDFDTADTPKNPRVPFLWVGVGNSPPPAEFGKVIRL